MNRYRNNLISMLCVLILLVLSGCASPPPASPKSMNQELHSTINQDSTMINRADAKNQLIILMSTPSLNSITDGSSRPGQSKQYREYLASLESEFGVRAIAEWSLSSVSLWCIVVQSDNRLPPAQLVDELAQLEQIDAVQPMQTFSLLTQPNDDPHRHLQTGLSAIRAEAAHRLATGDGVKVALIDTGVDINHVDIKSQLVDTENFVDDDISNFSSDVHGTAMASVIAASRNNNEGLIGVAPDASLLALKACWATRPGIEGASCSSFSLALAIDYALRREVDIINLSLTGPSDLLLERLLSQAIANGTVVVGAGTTQVDESFPANVDGVVAVVDESEREVSGTSNILAPGRDILAARPGSNYDFFSGRSMAVAHVTGIAALIRQRRPHVSSAEMMTILKTNQKLDACEMVAKLIHAECQTTGLH